MKYVLESGERQIMSKMVTVPGESSWSEGSSGRLYLTNRRLVFTSSTGIVALLVGRLIDAFLPQMQNIVYQISLKDISQLRFDERKVGIITKNV